jgi:hypothetical protein
MLHAIPYTLLALYAQPRERTFTARADTSRPCTQESSCLKLPSSAELGNLLTISGPVHVQGLLYLNTGPVECCHAAIKWGRRLTRARETQGEVLLLVLLKGRAGHGYSSNDACDCPVKHIVNCRNVSYETLNEILLLE